MIDVKQGVLYPLPPPEPSRTPLPGGAAFQGKPQGCGCETGGDPSGLALIGLVGLALRRRRSRR